MLHQILLYYVLPLSLLAAILTVYDKAIAGSGRRRIPEKTLLLLAVLGGAPAMYLTMLLIRHKTRHKKFMIGLPVIMLLQAALIYWLLLRH